MSTGEAICSTYYLWHKSSPDQPLLQLGYLLSHCIVLSLQGLDVALQLCFDSLFGPAVLLSC